MVELGFCGNARRRPFKTLWQRYRATGGHKKALRSSPLAGSAILDWDKKETERNV
jgi:hypothetical protein